MRQGMTPARTDVNQGRTGEGMVGQGIIRTRADVLFLGRQRSIGRQQACRNWHVHCDMRRKRKDWKLGLPVSASRIDSDAHGK